RSFLRALLHRGSSRPARAHCLLDWTGSTAPPLGPSRKYPSRIFFPPFPFSLFPVCAGGDVWSCLADGSLCGLRLFSGPLCAHLLSELPQSLAHFNIFEYNCLHLSQPAGARRIIAG